MSSEEKPPRSLPKPLDAAAALEEALTLLPPRAEVVLIGGLALAYFGIERYTKDVDLAASPALGAEMQRLFADRQPKILRIGGVSLAMSNGVRVDFIDRHENYANLFAALLADQQQLTARVGQRQVRVAPLHFLVALKLVADRPQDEADLHRLLALEALDYARARALVAAHVGAYAAQRLDKLARLARRHDAPPDYSDEPS